MITSLAMVDGLRWVVESQWGRGSGKLAVVGWASTGTGHIEPVVYGAEGDASIVSIALEVEETGNIWRLLPADEEEWQDVIRVTAREARDA